MPSELLFEISSHSHYRQQ